MTAIALGGIILGGCGDSKTAEETATIIGKSDIKIEGG